MKSLTQFKYFTGIFFFVFALASCIGGFALELPTWYIFTWCGMVCVAGAVTIALMKRIDRKQ